MSKEYNYAYLGKDIQYGVDRENVLMKGDIVYARTHGDTATIEKHVNFAYNLGFYLGRQSFFDVPLKDLRPINSESIKPNLKGRCHGENWYINEIFRISDEYKWEASITGTLFEDGFCIEVYSVEEDGTLIHIAREEKRRNESGRKTCKRLYGDLIAITSKNNN